MRTIFGLKAYFEIAICAFVFLFLVGSCLMKGRDLFAIPLIVLLFIVILIFRQKKLLKIIELTSSEISVRYFVFPFYTFWHSFREYDGVVVVDVIPWIPRYNFLFHLEEYLFDTGRHLYIVKDHKLKIDINLNMYKNSNELEDVLQKRLPYLAHVKSRGYLFSPGKLVY